MCIYIKSICFYRTSLMTFNNDAETKRCMGDRIGGCVSISEQRQKDVRKIGLEDVYQYQSRDKKM